MNVGDLKLRPERQTPLPRPYPASPFFRHAVETGRGVVCASCDGLSTEAGGFGGRLGPGTYVKG